MELVYLWVEDYKNIKRQGFNFSPRFRCEFKAEYDENNKLKDDCELIIDENKDYVSILPDNINITAIVGENGSGKSSIFEIILTEYETIKTNIFILIFVDNKLQYISNNIKLKEFIKLKDYNLEKIIYFSNRLSSIVNKSKIPESIHNQVPKRLEQDLVTLYKELYKNDHFDIYKTEFGLFTLNLKEILAKNPDTFKEFDERIHFKKYKYYLDFSILMNNIKDDKFYINSINNCKENDHKYKKGINSSTFNFIYNRFHLLFPLFYRSQLHNTLLIEFTFI